MDSKYAYKWLMNSKTPKDSHYARLRRQYRDSQNSGPKSNRPALSPETVPDGLVRLYGLHTVRAALANPRRKLKRLLLTQNAFARLEIAQEDLPLEPEFVEPRAIDRLLGSDAVHQGAMLEALPLRPCALSALGDSELVVVLDQVTDPHNVGAIMRSAVAFNGGALITTVRHSPIESGVLAKSASGALELIDHICIGNLATAIEQLHKAGFTTFGLDSEGPLALEDTFTGKKIALVLGAEGKGLRQKTRETVSYLARLDMPGEIKSLNVSNATAIALYAARNFLKAK